ncbi:MAG: GNAT family N-acetyltransferase [Sporichthyaceae bacterium]|nr:GNAT family N-acetyltransferase [Sporichthyaceae bacterium]
MQCAIHPDATDFAAQAMAWLDRDPVVNSMVSSNTRMRLDGPLPVDQPPLLWLTVADDRDEIVGAAIRTPPRSLLLPANPVDVAVTIADFLATVAADTIDTRLPGVVGPLEPAEAFASRWAELTGPTSEVQMRQRIFRLDRVQPPAGVSGRLRQAGAADLDLCYRWWISFRDEAIPMEIAVGREHIARILDEGRFWLWELDGEPVSMVGCQAPAAGVVRIGPVYTPPELRGHGYASAATALVSQRALDAGAYACSLTTDLANPTSNAIYQRIGYYPVADAVSLRFAPTG